MRLIDANAFERDLTEHILPILIQRYGEEEAIRGLHFSYSDCISNISGQPTIEERKTGRWEDVHIDVANDDKGRSYRFYSCTACGVTSIPAMLGMKKEWLHFCPNCGAKMEG